MRRIGCSAVAFALVLLAGCGDGPYRRSETIRNEAYVRFIGGRAAQSVYIDGVHRGGADEFNGNPHVLAVSPGLRSIEVRDGDRVVLREQVYVGAGVIRTFDLPQ